MGSPLSTSRTRKPTTRVRPDPFTEVPTLGYSFEADYWERLPELDRKDLRRLVELGALSASALEGGEWRVNEKVRHQLQAAAEIVYRATSPSIDERRGRDWLARANEAVEWPGPWLLHCVFGNPFRPVTLDPRSRTADVLGLARGAYEDRAFDRLPLLADALMDAGCDDEQVLAHCRSEGPHVRGCWVVDLVLEQA